MLLSEVFDDRLSSTELIGANNEKSNFGKVFSSNSYVGFYFHYENVINPMLDSDTTDQNRRHQQSKPCSQFLEHARILLKNLRDGSSGGGNANKAKSTSGQCSTNVAIIFVQVPQFIEDQEQETVDCIVGHDLRDDGIWILSAKDAATVLLLRTFKIRVPPAFVIVDAKTKRTIAVDGRRALQADPSGRRFPWHLPEPSDVFGGKLISKTAGNQITDSVEMDEIVGGIKCLLFAAHWCPPCRSIVKQLTHTYSQLKNGGQSSIQFEVVFCSMDRCEESFRQFYADMPWLAFPYNDPRCIAAARLFNVQEIPTLLILDADNQLITRHGKAELAMDPDGKEFPWYPKVVLELNSHTASRVRENTSFLLFTEGAPEDLVFAQTSLLPVAEEFCMKSTADQQDLLFFYCGEDPVCDQVWDALMLGDASLPLICIVDPFTNSLYVCDDPNVSEIIIRRFIAKFYTGDLEPTRRLPPPPLFAGNRGNYPLNSPQHPNVGFSSNESNTQIDQTDSSAFSNYGAKRQCVNVGGGDSASLQRYCL